MKLKNSRDLATAIRQRKEQLAAKKSATTNTGEKKKEGEGR